MSKQYDERVAYNTKTEYLRRNFREVNAVEFYSVLFPPCSFEGKGCPSDLRPNGLLTDLHHYFAWKHNELEEDEHYGRCNHMIFDDHEIITDYKDAKYVIVSPVGYFGRKPTERNSHTFFAFVLDIDDVTPDNLEQLCWGWQNNYFGEGYGSYPKPTFITNSGHGCHLYYILKEPVPMYPQTREKLKAFKNDFLTQICCDSSKGGNTSKEDPDILQLCQGFRMVGSYSKLGKGYPVRAFRTGDKVDFEYLNKWVDFKGYPQEMKITDFAYHSKLTLAQAKEKYPDWYEYKIEQKGTLKKWLCKRALYDWWLRTIKQKAKVGGRYYAIWALVSYAKKCGIDYEELESDAMSLIEPFDSLKKRATDEFTADDVKAALKSWENPDFVRLPRRTISAKTKIAIPENKRSGQRGNQKWHLEDARAKKERMKNRGQAFKNPEGRPSYEDRIKRWQIDNPNGKPKDCMEFLQLKKSVVYKYWSNDKRQYNKKGFELKGFTEEENAIMTQRGEFYIPEFDDHRKKERGVKK